MPDHRRNEEPTPDPARAHVRSDPRSGTSGGPGDTESRVNIQRSPRQPPRWIGIGLAVTAVIVLVMLVLLWRMFSPGTDGTGTLPDDISAPRTAPAQPQAP
jgi:hypothetical protein